MSNAPSSEHVNFVSERLDHAPLSAFLDAMLTDFRSTLDVVRMALPQLESLASEFAQTYASGKRIILVGAGTSGRLCALEAAECPPTFGTDPSRIMAIIAGGPAGMLRSIEGAEDNAHAGTRAIAALDASPGDLVIAVSASGTTPFVCSAIEESQRRGLSTTAIVGNGGSPLSTRSDRTIILNCGPEFVAGSTRLKAGSAQKLALNLVTTGAMKSLGRVRHGRMVGVQATNEKLRARAIRTIEELTDNSASEAAMLLDAAGGDLFAVLRDFPHPEASATPPLPELVYRTIGLADVPQIITLAADPAVVATTAPFAQLGGESLFSSWIIRPGFKFGAFADERLVGVTLVDAREGMLREHVADVVYVAVAQRARGQGIGQQLICRTLDWAKSNRITRVELRVWPDNVSAIRLYSRMGFELEGRMRRHAIVDGRIYDALLMAWIDPSL